jgi:hypothetical protein
MTVTEFTATLPDAAPPIRLQPALVALWYDAKGNWEAAHNLVQDVPDDSGAWVHAYLHRKEGDESNAGYWYRRAGRPQARGSLEDEWTAIASVLLAD